VCPLIDDHAAESEPGDIVNGTGEIVETAKGPRYYEKGKPREKGLVCVDGDYYFTLYNGKLITDQNYYAWMTNCDLPKEWYEFGADGKMLQGIV
jgi:hypothetical protein